MDIFMEALKKAEQDKLNIGNTILESFEKGRAAQIGEIREWQGGKYQKTVQGWIPVKQGGGSAKKEEKKGVSQGGGIPKGYEQGKLTAKKLDGMPLNSSFIYSVKGKEYVYKKVSDFRETNWQLVIDGGGGPLRSDKRLADFLNDENEVKLIDVHLGDEKDNVRKQGEIRPGDTVMFKDIVDPGDDTLRMRVLEDRGDSYLVQEESKYSLKGTRSVRKDEIKVVKE